MNKYGYLIYEDYPINTSATASLNYQTQVESETIADNVKVDFENYATFEKQGLDFDKSIYFYSNEDIERYDTIKFTKRIDYNGLINVRVYYKQGGEWYDVEERNNYIGVIAKTSTYIKIRPKVQETFELKIVGRAPVKKIISTSVDLSDVNGEFENAHTLTITPAEAVSGSGFALKTLIDDYTISVTVTDTDGTRTNVFRKTDDEFYSFIYDGLQSIVVEFTQITPYSFVKIAGFALGTVRIFDESKIKDFPTIVEHFSYTGEELEVDTLDFELEPDSSLNLLEGQKITYSRTGRVFYINTAERAFNGIISVSCYDDVARLDNEFYGIWAQSDSISTELTSMLQGGNSDITVDITYYQPILTFTGIIPPTTNRDAARLLMLGIGSRLHRKANSHFDVVSIIDTSRIQPTGIFNEDTILGLPEIEKLEKYGKISFLKHYYKQHSENGREEIFNGLIDKNIEQTITWNEPHKSITFWYVSGQDESGNDEYTAVDPNDFTIVERGNFHAKVINKTYNQRISAWGYPVKESHTRIDTAYPNMPSRFKNNVKDITEVCALMDFTNDDLRAYLQQVYKCNKKVAFKSDVEVSVGDYVQVNIYDAEYKGWVTLKKDEARGLYHYEVLCE